MIKRIFIMALILFVTPLHAALVFSIDNYTTDELSFTISGTFDLDTVGDAPGYLAIKNDWSNNGGIHTELFASTPLITFNTITIGGLTPTTAVQNGANAWMDDVYFTNPLGPEVAILAGTSVLGTMTLSAVGAFDPLDQATLELVSGFVRPFSIGLSNDWARLEASTHVVPIPSAIWFFGTGLLGLMGFIKKPRYLKA